MPTINPKRALRPTAWPLCLTLAWMAASAPKGTGPCAEQADTSANRDIDTRLAAAQRVEHKNLVEPGDATP